MKSNLYRFIPALILMSVIFYLSSQPGSTLDSWMPFFQWIDPAMNDFNWAHFVAYFFLGLTYFWALGKSSLRGKIVVILLCVLYGTTDEFHQMFTPHRDPDIHDLFHDALGATLAMIVISVPIVDRMVKKWRSTMIY